MSVDSASEIVIRRYGAGQAPPIVETAADVWADSHPELADGHGAANEELSVPAFKRQMAGHLAYTGFTLVVAYGNGSMVGFGYAFPCTPDYWFGTGLLQSVPRDAR